MMQLAAEHRFELGCTWQDTAETLTRAGYRTRTGQPWTLHGLRTALLTWQRNMHSRCPSDGAHTG